MPGGIPRRWLALAVLAAAIAWPTARLAASDAPALEYKVKAGYLFNFAKFIEWPALAGSTADRPLVIGVIDDGEALPVLRGLLDGKQVNGRTITVKAVASDRIGDEVQILLVTRAAGKKPDEIRASLGKSATLLVGETEFFSERGGMVAFVREDDAIRLTLNLERTAEVGLKVSAKLATVARVVKSQPVR